MSISINSSLQNSAIQSYYLNEKIQKEEESDSTIKTNSEAAPETVAVSDQGDILEISAAGQAASANQQNAENEDADSSDYELSSLKASAQTASSVLEQTSEDDESISSDLSTYSDAELRELYQDGEITAAEYSQEVARRKAELGMEEESE